MAVAVVGGMVVAAGTAAGGMEAAGTAEATCMEA